MARQGVGDRGGRPASTTPHAIAAAAQRLFVERGFEATSVADVTAAVGISTRTFFRYFPTKADVLWVESPAELARFRAVLEAAAPDEPYVDVLIRGVCAALVWNPDDEQWARHRALLVTTEPAVQAHVGVVLGLWRDAATAHVRRARPGADALLPVLVGHALVAGLLAAHERWVAEPGSDLHVLLAEALGMVLPTRL